VILRKSEITVMGRYFRAAKILVHSRKLVISGFLCLLLLLLGGRGPSGKAGKVSSPGGRDLLNLPSFSFQSGRSFLLPSFNFIQNNQEDTPPLQDDWLQGLSSQGFLQVEEILKDPKTTQEPFTTEKGEKSAAERETNENKEKSDSSEFFVFREKQEVKETDGKDFNDSEKSDKNNTKVKTASKEESDKNEDTADINKEVPKYTPRELPNFQEVPKKFNLSQFYKQYKDKKLNRPSKAEMKARVKQDLKLAIAEKNSSDFRHVMLYNENFVPHLTRDLYIPGYQHINSNLCNNNNNNNGNSSNNSKSNSNSSSSNSNNSSSNIFLMILVISAPDHSKERASIREGWGRSSQRGDVCLGFLVGIPQSEAQLQVLKEEADKYGDLIISNVEDVYENLSLKILAGLDWVLRNGIGAQFVMKVDDDMFVQVDKLIELLKAQDRNKRLILGNISRGWKPVRNPNSKYYITERQYQQENYPDFATGPSYVIAGNSIRAIFESAMAETYLHLEDVFITGVIAEKNGIERLEVGEFKNNANRIPARFMGCTIAHTITIHKVRPEEQVEFEELARNPNCPPRIANARKKP